MERLSVVISAYDQHELTVQHVKECFASNRRPDEVIVVNDAGHPRLLDMLGALDDKKGLIYARIENEIEWNYTGARNLGIWLSTGDRLAMEDNDNIPYRDFYEEAMKLDTPRVVSNKRPKIDLHQVLTVPFEKWHNDGWRPYHRDTSLMKREVFWNTKGYDERFAGAYGWCSTDWRRRIKKFYGEDIDRAPPTVSHYWTVVDGETRAFVRRKSYRNYGYAREGNAQAPGPILNFNYEVTRLG